VITIGLWALSGTAAASLYISSLWLYFGFCEQASYISQVIPWPMQVCYVSDQQHRLWNKAWCPHLTFLFPGDFWSANNLTKASLTTTGLRIKCEHSIHRRQKCVILGIYESRSCLILSNYKGRWILSNEQLWEFSKASKYGGQEWLTKCYSWKHGVHNSKDLQLVSWASASLKVHCFQRWKQYSSGGTVQQTDVTIHFSDARTISVLPPG
jgi:hypothetical protein